MFSLIAFIISYISIVYECGKIGNITYKNRLKAKQKGIVYYFTGDNKIKSTKTDEVVMRQYVGGNKLVGVKTGTVYRDYDKERTEEFVKYKNNNLSENSPVYYKVCKEYWDPKHKTYKNVHLYEKSTDRPYSVLSPYGLKKDGTDKTCFTICYLNENDNMKSLSEFAYIPKEYYYNYLFGN